VIPAHDEADHIEDCLEALRIAVDHVRDEVASAHAVVVADRCRDGTAHVAARRLQGWGEVLEVEAGGAGRARAAGVRRLLELWPMDHERLWLASSDADTVVPPDWLTHQIGLARLGVVAIAGIVAVDSFADHPPHVPVRWAELYDGPGTVSHPHVHGANLGVRADAYLALGGWEAVDRGEDLRLWRALEAAAFELASPRSLVVTTSGRSRSRVSGGFADSLNVLGAAAS
jgi:hypothetical protein